MNDVYNKVVKYLRKHSMNIKNIRFNNVSLFADFGDEKRSGELRLYRSPFPRNSFYALTDGKESLEIEIELKDVTKALNAIHSWVSGE